MSQHNYIIGTGYHYRSEADCEFNALWWRCIFKARTRADVMVVSTSYYGHMAHGFDLYIPGQNFGHVGDLLNGTRQHPLCGWSVCALTLAMNAYAMGKDLIFVEQDCLCFGPWIERMYQDLGDGDMVFGPKMQTAPYMACAQALFLIRHSALLRFISAYLALPPDKDMLPESKFAALGEHGLDVRYLSFGVDRERPIPWDAEVFYVQQWTAQELNEAKERGLI